MRKTKPNYSDRMDGEFDNIPDPFNIIYDKLYNCVNDAEEVEVVSNKIDNSIQAENIEDVDRVTNTVIIEAVSKLKAGKADPAHRFSSDCFKTNSYLPIESLTFRIKTFFIPGYVPQFMLLATLVPFIKDKLRSIASSKNYRSVCITSLVLKVFN
jgi:hypothetical protein